MDTSVYVCNFVGRVWRTLAKYSPTSLQYGLLLNKASQLSSVSSHAVACKLRPDTMLIAESCTLMLGEDQHTDLAAACADLERKRVDLSGMHYGPLKFMLGYAAAGTVLQWCFLPCHADQVRILAVLVRVACRSIPLLVVLSYLLILPLCSKERVVSVCCSLCKCWVPGLISAMPRIG